MLGERRTDIHTSARPCGQSTLGWAVAHISRRVLQRRGLYAVGEDLSTERGSRPPGLSTERSRLYT